MLTVCRLPFAPPAHHAWTDLEQATDTTAPSCKARMRRVAQPGISRDHPQAGQNPRGAYSR